VPLPQYTNIVLSTAEVRLEKQHNYHSATEREITKCPLTSPGGQEKDECRSAQCPFKHTLDQKLLLQRELSDTIETLRTRRDNKISFVRYLNFCVSFFMSFI